MKIIAAIALLGLAVPMLANAQGLGASETEVKLDTGNIELAVNDGTTISVAPGTHLTIDPAKLPGDFTRINVLRGEFRVSNVFNKHSDIVLIRTGDHTFELNRGSALIQNDGTRPQGILLHGTSLSLQGTPNKLTRPGMRLQLQSGDGGVQQDRVGPDAMNAAINKVSGRVALRAAGGVRKALGQQRRMIIRKPDGKRLKSQVVQRSGFQTVVNGVQGLGAPPPPTQINVKPPKKPPMVHPPRGNPPRGNPPNGNPPRGNPPHVIPPRANPPRGMPPRHP